MAESGKIKFTDSQELAIHYDKQKNILVSASAGSGKTFVMTNRIIEKIRSGVELSSLFISTFTVKAAAELRNRIELAIKKELRDAGNSVETKQIFQKALQELALAAIGTTDAFANSLVKEYYNVVKINPNFRIMTDRAEQGLVMNQVFDDLLESKLSQEHSENFEKLIKNFSNDRNINGFKEVVYKIYYFCQSTVNVETWLSSNFLKAFENYSKYADLPEEIFDPSSVESDFGDLIANFQLAKEKKILSAKTQEIVDMWIEAAPYVLEALEEKDFQKFVLLIKGLKENAKLNGNNFKGKEIKELGIQDKFYEVMGGTHVVGSIPKLFEEVKFSELIESYHVSAKDLLEDLRDFLLEFIQNFSEKKRELDAFEFSDILHFALEILESEEHPEIREAYQNKYSEIMIDEYQDTNQAQEKLYQLISNGHNMFMVGDIKQSIYGFRQADPSLFQHKYENFPADESSDLNRLLFLQENFRSRREILDFTNDIFVKLMKNYSEKEKLKFPDREAELLQKFESEYELAPETEAESELLLYLPNSEEELSSTTKGEVELAASQVVNLINKGVKPSEIALLVRTKSNNEKIREIFEAHDIPIVLDDVPENYLKSIEIQVMLDVLRAVNNPLFDISLVALLHSPLFSFSEDDLAKISLQKGENFWEKIQSKNLQLDSQLYSKSLDFMSIFEKWRQISRSSSAHELIQEIYRDSLYLEYAAALPNGDQRKANLQALADRASSYESSGYKGLVKFIDMIDNYLQNKNDLVDVNHRLPQDAVRVQTIHKSKGLEFNYVFIMNFQQEFAKQDFKSDILLDKDLGAAIKFTADLAEDKKIVTDFPHALVKMETIPYLVNKQKLTKQIIDEEMRMLYVALTRAKKKLYLVAKINRAEDLTNFSSLNLESLPAKGYLTWILSLLEYLKDQKKSLIFEGPQVPSSQDKIRPDILSNLNEQESSWDETLEVGKVFAEAKKIMEFDSYNDEATKLSSTLSPSSLERQIREYEEEVPLKKDFEFKLDDFDKKVYSSADLGTAIHSFMQHLDFSQPDLFSLQALLDKMNLPDELKESIDVPKILTLFETDFGKKLIEHSASLRLESPFSMLKTIKKDGQVIDQTVVRGIIDGYYISENRIILFDYKTDHFSDDSKITEISRRYNEQQALYAEALSSANNGLPVDKYLILLGGPSEVKVVKINGRL